MRCGLLSTLSAAAGKESGFPTIFMPSAGELSQPVLEDVTTGVMKDTDCSQADHCSSFKAMVSA